jgi:hypothetical protein
MSTSRASREGPRLSCSRLTKKKASTRRKNVAKLDGWRAQNALLAETDAVRTTLRERLARFDDAALARLQALFTHLARVVAVESPAADATIEALARTHDLFFPARSIVRPARRKERTAVALGPIRAACAEVHRGGDAREHARFARWRLVQLVDSSFGALDLDAMAKDIERKPRPDGLLVKWNARVGLPLGKLTAKSVAQASRA